MKVVFIDILIPQALLKYARHKDERRQNLSQNYLQHTHCRVVNRLFHELGEQDENGMEGNS